MNETMQAASPAWQLQAQRSARPFPEVSSPPPTTVTCRLGVLDEVRTIFGSGQFGAGGPSSPLLLSFGAAVLLAAPLCATTTSAQGTRPVENAAWSRLERDRGDHAGWRHEQGAAGMASYLAFMHAAIYDAVVGVEGGYQLSLR
jgi:hypothetical protein